MDIILDFVWAFVIGGLLCSVAQILIDKTALTPARILVSYVVTGVLLGAIGHYEPLMDIAGAGASTPLTGFGYAISKGVKEAIKIDGAIGILNGALSATASVITAVLLFSLIAALLTKSKPR